MIGVIIGSDRVIIVVVVYKSRARMCVRQNSREMEIVPWEDMKPYRRHRIRSIPLYIKWTCTCAYYINNIQKPDLFATAFLFLNNNNNNASELNINQSTFATRRSYFSLSMVSADNQPIVYRRARNCVTEAPDGVSRLASGYAGYVKADWLEPVLTRKEAPG